MDILIGGGGTTENLKMVVEVIAYIIFKAFPEILQNRRVADREYGCKEMMEARPSLHFCSLLQTGAPLTIIF